MIIKPMASGSSGNCYYVSDGKTNILLDCGIPVQKIKEFLWSEGKRLSDIDACLVTHSHGDHVKSAQKLADMGIDIYASRETIEAANLKGAFVYHFLERDVEGSYLDILVNSILVKPLAVEHDAPGTAAFILSAASAECGRLLYITDTPVFRYNVRGVTHLVIESNNDPGIIAANAADGTISVEHAKRVVQNHMSIETCLKTIECMDRGRLEEIWLVHLSDDNAGSDFKQRVQELAGVPVHIA